MTPQWSRLIAVVLVLIPIWSLAESAINSNPEEVIKAVDSLYGLSMKNIGEGSDFVRDKTHFSFLEKAQREQAERTDRVRKVLSEGAGVYKDKVKGAVYGLHRTVVTTVISHPKASHWYRIYFRNFLCFADHYGYDVVVYVMRNKEQSQEEFEAHTSEIGSYGVKALPYPEELFWRLVYGRTRPLRVGKRHAAYKGSRPDFRDFGSLPMLVPMYEIIAFGYDMIYLDVDLGLVLDPIPHMLHGDADFVTSVESRDCTDHPHHHTVNTTNWDIVESNTGVSLIRSTPQSKATFLKWMEVMVDENYINDQRILDKWFKRYNDMTYTSNCLPPGTPSAIDPSVASIRPTVNSTTYCLLSDVLFQNGLMSLTCCRQRMDQYIIAMHDYGIKINDSYYPALIHVNFAGGKTAELDERGLWLYQHENGTKPDGTRGSCRPYRRENTHYAHNYNYSQELERIYTTYNTMYQDLNKPGEALIKLKTAHEVFLLGNDSQLHGFPDGDTFVAMGYDFGNVNTVDALVYERWGIGDPLPSMAEENSHTAQKRRKHDAIIEQRNREGTNAAFSSPNIIMKNQH
jgi:hypothetical protein